jgi:hypothetical protein
MGACLFFKVEDITKLGGNESKIPKKFSEIMRPHGWKEVKITGDLLIKLHTRNPSSVEEVRSKHHLAGKAASSNTGAATRRLSDLCGWNNAKGNCGLGEKSCRQ